jgi:secondary thiamine-phosphate synthase enzyme
MVHGDTISVRSGGFSDIHDITAQVQAIINDSGIHSGIASIFVPGSTASISTIEYEPALVEDMKDQLDKFASHDMKSRHSETWGDDNGFSHIRATFMGPGMTVPFSNGHLINVKEQEADFCHFLLDHRYYLKVNVCSTNRDNIQNK